MVDWAGPIASSSDKQCEKGLECVDKQGDSDQSKMAATSVGGQVWVENLKKSPVLESQKSFRNPCP